MNSQSTQTNHIIELTCAEYKDAKRILKQLHETPRPSCMNTAGEVASCTRCQKMFWKNEVIQPDKLGIYFPHRTCLYCLAERCIANASVIVDLERDFHYLYSNPDYIPLILSKHNEVLYYIYHHPTHPLKTILTQPKDNTLYSYDITI